ncbi:MAG: VCBS repeat-containing protein, partial [Planctomycetota bacterium]
MSVPCLPVPCFSRRLFSGLLLLLVIFIGCKVPSAPLPSNTHWTRHTIDSRFRGADGVKLGDADGDGLIDLVVGWEESGVVVVYLNPGPGGVTANWPAVTVGQVEDVEDAVFVDLDADGLLDVVSCSEGDTKTMYVHWAPGDVAQYSSSAAWVTAELPVTRNARQWMFCEPAQIDGVGGVELVAGAKGDNGQVGYLSAPVDPTNLAGWTWHALADAAWIMSIEPRDIDGDGDIDIVYTDRKGAARGVYWLENPGGANPLPAAWQLHTIGVGAAEFMFADVADYDGDGQLEIIAATDRRQALLYEPLAIMILPWQQTPISWSDSYGTGKSVRFGDLDLDGMAEIVFSCENANSRYGVG